MLGRIQRAQLERAVPPAAAPARPAPAQRVPPVQVVGAVAGHQRQPLAGEPGQQEHQQVPAGPVGPVQVLQHHQGRGGRGQLVEHRQHGVEHPHLAEPPILGGRIVAGVVAGQQVAQRAVPLGQLGCRSANRPTISVNGR